MSATATPLPARTARRRACVLAALSALAAFAVDQATKWFALVHLWPPGWPVEVTGFFNLALGFNPGVTFGIGRGLGLVAPWAVAAVTGLVLAVIAWMALRAPTRTEAAGYGLVLGGGVGNLLDRLRIGAVVDFLDLHYAGWHWPAFNMADVAIVCGVLLLVSIGWRRAPPAPTEGISP